MNMISLIGEQPVPNLLPLLFMKPERALLVHTKHTEKVAWRLQRLLNSRGFDVRIKLTDPYDVNKIQKDIEESTPKERDLFFNLTGGTKTMMIAAYEVARKCNAPFVYLQSEGKRSVLYRYRFENGEVRCEGKDEIPGLLTIEDFLRVHLDPPYPKFTGPRHTFEKAIGDILKEVVDEVVLGVTLASAVEVDLMVRVDNQVGVIQAKTGSKARSKEGLDQLNAACEQRYLGTYTYKFLVVNQKWDHTLSNLRELAEAWRITLIELPSFSEVPPYFSDEEQKYLQEKVIKVLKGGQ